MAIDEITGFQFAGKIYATELDAVRAALTEIGSRIVKEHSAAAHVGLIQHRDDLIDLLARYSALTHGDDV